MSARRATPTALVAVCLVAACTAETGFDLVIEGGRVMDPESGLDGTRNIGIRDGRIAAISEDALAGHRVIDAAGLVVAPGFVDLHEHGQDEAAYGLMVRDGVTSALELEVGTADVAGWYAKREGGQIVNYGVSIGHIPVRMAVLGDPGTGLVPAGVGGSGTASPEQLDDIERRLRRGLAEGAVAMGFGTAYTPGATMEEIERMFRVAAEAGVSAHVHIRNGVAGLDSTLAAARAVGMPLHVVHANSSAGPAITEFLAVIEAARDAGQDVTTETYPYSAGMTEIQSALFDDWESWGADDFQRHQLVSTGERLTRESFARARREGGTVIIHDRTEKMTRTAVASPLTMIASDGFLENGRGHPRTSGSYSRVLGRYVREEGLLTLMEALRKMTVAPARRLEARVPGMRDKGRLRVGADADVTIFDPATIIDRSTYEDATIPAQGIPYVIVGGVVVVDGGALTRARPGRAIRVVAFDRARATAAVSAVLDALHHHASVAEEEAYFGLFAPEGVFFGTDASERWTIDQFRAYAHRRFATGQGWTYVLRAGTRHVEFDPTGTVAWFDEILDNASYGETRGTGVLRLIDGDWKIAQYHLTIPLPNALADSVVGMIRGMAQPPSR